jgi:hypothetical protein
MAGGELRFGTDSTYMGIQYHIIVDYSSTFCIIHGYIAEASMRATLGQLLMDERLRLSSAQTTQKKFGLGKPKVRQYRGFSQL